LAPNRQPESCPGCRASCRRSSGPTSSDHTLCASLRQRARRDRLFGPWVS
jgi:hypothetical protein